MYTDKNFRSKKQLKEAVAAAVAGTGPAVTTYQPGGMFPAQRDGLATIEGPHYPEPHKWYAAVILKDGSVVKVVS